MALFKKSLENKYRNSQIHFQNQQYNPYSHVLTQQLIIAYSQLTIKTVGHWTEFFQSLSISSKLTLGTTE